MATKKQDQKLIASKQDYEMDYICGVWYNKSMQHLKISVLRDVVKKIGRSRKNIYAVLKYLGYHYDPRKKSKKKFSLRLPDNIRETS